MQAQTNISWMSTQNIRYPQSKRHPDFAKQTPESGSYSGSPSPYPPPPPSSSQIYSNSTTGSPHPHGRNSGPPPGSSPPSAAAAGWVGRDNYRMPAGQHSSGSFYPQHPGYPGNSTSPHGGQQRDSIPGGWHDQRAGPPPSSSSSTGSSSATPSNNSMDSPMTTAHWSSNRYPPGSGGNSGYGPPEFGSQPHFAPGSAQAGKMMTPGQYSMRTVPPPPPSQTAQQTTDPSPASSRSGFGPMSHAINNGTNNNSIPPGTGAKMMNSGSHAFANQYPPPPPTSGSYGSNSGPAGHHHHHHHSGQLIRSQRANELSQQHQQAPPPTAIFPPNSVEATVPIPSKRRKLMARDIAPVDAWRVYMALKSGLLAESTYALDVLNVISNDDISLLFLSLPNMPGLLDVLLEHYRRYLNEMFDSMLDDIEIGYEDRLKQQKQLTNANLNGESKSHSNDNDSHSNKLKWYEVDRDRKDEQDHLLLNDVDDDIEGFLDRKFKLNGRPKLTLFQDQTNNYTNITRNGKTVKVKKDKNLFIMDYDKQWDPSGNGFLTKQEHWLKGGGETTTHIQSHMEPKERYLRFCRLITKQQQDNHDDDDDDVEIVEQNGENCENNHHTNGHESDQMNDDKDKDKDNGDNNDNNDDDDDQYPKIHPTDRERYWKRLHQPDFEDESYDQEEPAVCTGREYQDSIKSRCLTVSNLIRNLTFVPGNDIEMCRSSCLLLILSRLILLHHVHALKKKRKISEIDCTKIVANRLDEETMFNLIDEKCDSDDARCDKSDCMMDCGPEKEWWWEALHLIRENTMVTLANISGQLDLSSFPESITLALLDGLLHWAICPSSYAQDAFPSAPNTLSPRRLAYEALSKLSIYESNVDLILATPPWTRIEKFLKNLTRSLVRNEDQTIREFSIVLISNFATADPSVVRVIALSGYSVSLLLGFIEQAEQSALGIANAHGIQYLRENFDAIGTTPDMVRRAATILRTLARYSENRSLFIQHEQRLLSLSMSQILDTSISSIIADILYECSFETIINNYCTKEANLPPQEMTTN